MLMLLLVHNWLLLLPIAVLLLLLIIEWLLLITEWLLLFTLPIVVLLLLPIGILLRGVAPELTKAELTKAHFGQNLLKLKKVINEAPKTM